MDSVKRAYKFIAFWLSPIGTWLFGLIISFIGVASLVVFVIMLISGSSDAGCENNPLVGVNQPKTETVAASGDWTKQGTGTYDVAMKIFDYFTKKEGFSGAAAAGVVANAKRESMFKLDAKNAGGGVAGLFQWSGYNGNTTNGSRWTSNGHANDDFSFDGQMNLAHAELAGAYSSTKKTVSTMTDPFEAAKSWTKLYEGVDPDNDPQAKLTQLKADAQQAYTMFNGASIQASQPQGGDGLLNAVNNGNSDASATLDAHSVGAGCNIDGGTDDGTTSPYIFDKTEQGFVLNDGIDGPGHAGKHDGWDINPIGHPVNPDGPDIYAVKSGKIIKIQQGNQSTQMPLIEIKTTLNDQKIVLVYQEFKAKSIPTNLKEGDTIQAGQKVGEMGSMFPDGQINGALTPNGFVSASDLGTIPANATAASFGNHLHFAVKTYKTDNTNYPSWASNPDTLDPGLLFGLGMGKESGNYKWGQMKSGGTQW
jgi:Peptidase family M23.